MVSIICAMTCIAVMALTLNSWNRAFRNDLFSIPSFLWKFQRAINSFFVVNSYGLFAVMTTERIELIIEASEDGENWVPYEFKYKPGDCKRSPPFILGHMPRLDWRMWFLPFSEFPQIPSWFVQFLEQLRNGNPDVSNLMGNAPCVATNFLRVTKYDYKFTSRKELKETGDHWKRTLKGKYIPFVLVNKKLQ